MPDPTDVLYIVVGLTHILFALGLLALNAADRLNQSFALYLALLGGAFIVPTVDPVSPFTTGINGLFWYLNLGSSLPLLYLAACYRDRFGKQGLRRVALPVLVGLAILLESLYLYDHGLLVGTGFRPLKALHLALLLLGPGIMAAVLARDAFGAASDQQRRHLLMASLGFAFYPTAFGLHLFIPDIMDNLPLVEQWIGIVGLLPAAYVAFLLARTARRERASAVGSSARNYLALLALSPISVVGLFIAQQNMPLDEAKAVMRFVMTGWLVVLVLLVGYAILRHQLFGIEIGMKWTIRRGTFPSILLAVFFVGGQILESMLQSRGGPNSWIFAGVAVAAVGLAYQPLQRFADRFAEKAMPNVEDSPIYAKHRRIQLYESALSAAWEDGVLTKAERMRLDDLRGRLHLSAAETGTLESRFARRPVRPTRRARRLLRSGA